MKNSKLLTIYFALSVSEKRELEKYLQSPFVNHRQDVINLLKFLRNSEVKSKVNYQKQAVFSQIFPHEKYDDSKMRHCMSFLYRHIENYLALKIGQRDAVQQKINLAKAYRERKLEKQFLKTMEMTKTLLDKMPRDQHYYRFNFLLESEQYNYIRTKKRTTEYNLQSLTDAYDIQFLVNKLKQSCSQFSHQAVYNVDYDAGLLPVVLEFLSEGSNEEKSEYLKIPAIAIYYYTYKALTENSEPHFQKLKIQIENSVPIFPKDEMEDVFLFAINFCIRQLNDGNQQYIREAFELYQLGLKSEVIARDKKLSRFTYKNIAALGLRLGEFEWVNHFIQQYKNMIDKPYRESYFQYNSARLAFFQKDYKKAMLLLVQLHSQDLLLNIDAKIILLKMYYELDEFDALDALLASFKTYLNRKTLMGYHRDNYLKIIELTKKMLYLNFNDRSAIQKLNKEIEQSNVSEKEWLMKQLMK